MTQERVVALIDMDCFYCQVESRLDPGLVGVPMAVVQYNAWKGGGIIAVNYEARDFGVTRNMRGDEARSKCPAIRLVKVPEACGKADLTRYRDAGKEVINVLLTFGSAGAAAVERASVDEAYINLTNLVEEKLRAMAGNDDERAFLLQPKDLPNTCLMDGGGYERLEPWLQNLNESDVRLAVGASIVEEMRAAIHEKTGFQCSAGISHNKLLSKLACGLNKPNKQTILPNSQLADLFRTLPLTKLRGLGGKLGGQIVQHLGCKTVQDLSGQSLGRLRQHFDDKIAKWLHDVARGLDDEPVKERQLASSIGCSKNFNGPKEMLDTKDKLELWMGQLCQELVERLNKDKEANRRLARSFNVSVVLESKGGQTLSRVAPLNEYDKPKMVRQALSLIAKMIKDASKPYKVKNLTISAGKFEDLSKSTLIVNFFEKAEASVVSTREVDDEPVKENQSDKSIGCSKNFKGTKEMLDTKAKIEWWIGQLCHKLLECLNRDKGINHRLARSLNVSLVLEGGQAFSGVGPLNDYDKQQMVGRALSLTADMINDASAPVKVENVTISAGQFEQISKVSSLASASIGNFFRRTEEIATAVTVVPDNELDGGGGEGQNEIVDLVVCEKCDEMVSPFELPEHDDFHVAKELQKALNRQDLNESKVCGTKRKFDKDSSKSEDGNKKQRNITCFFQKKEELLQLAEKFDQNN